MTFYNYWKIHLFLPSSSVKSKTYELYFLESLMSLSERLAGPFDVEMTIEPISIKISDAIMNFQESGFQV